MYYTLHDIINAIITDDVVFAHVLLPMTTYYYYTLILHLIALVTV